MAATDRTGKAPAFQFYPKDYLGDEEQTLMSLPETGAYIRLLCRCWLKGSLPSEIPELAKLCGATAGQMAKFWPAVSRCFKPRSDGRWIHPRLDDERKKQAKNRAARSENGKLGGRPKKADAFSQESKPIADKSTASSSPLSNLQSAPTVRTTTTPTPRGAPLVAKRKGYAAWEGARALYVVHEQHQRFIGLRNHPEAEAELFRWYATVAEDWATGAHRGDSPGSNIPAFWDARFAEQWPAVTALRVASSPAGKWRPS